MYIKKMRNKYNRIKRRATDVCKGQTGNILNKYYNKSMNKNTIKNIETIKLRKLQWYAIILRHNS